MGSVLLTLAKQGSVPTSHPFESLKKWTCLPPHRKTLRAVAEASLWEAGSTVDSSPDHLGLLCTPASHSSWAVLSKPLPLGTLLPSCPEGVTLCCTFRGLGFCDLIRLGPHPTPCHL